MSETIKASAPAILIMLIIGMVIGTWILGGVVPTMIYYGLSWISPKVFLVTACLLCTLVATLFTNFATGVQYTALVLPGRMFRETFRERGLHPKNLSRILEDVGTLCAPFCPWGTDGTFILGTLGVAAGQYAPFMFFAMLNPIVSLICIWTGWTIERIDPSQKDMDIIP